jgi:hypothetical protein
MQDALVRHNCGAIAVKSVECADQLELPTAVVVPLRVEPRGKESV